MEIISLLVLCFISIIIGIVLTLVAQYYILAKFVQRKPLELTGHKSYFEKYCLPKDLKAQLETLGKGDGDTEKNIGNSSLAVSLLLQFLFYELRNRNAIKQWLYEKLSLEFDDLLTKTTTGKFFDAVKIVDLNLGSQFPNIKDIKVDSVKMDSCNEFIETMSLSLDIDYSGNFQLSVDTKMKFGKTAFLSITVKQIRGKARLQFTRIPYTHWSLCFYNDPFIELGVDSHFQSRQLHSNITSLIISQIKKAIKRKHTLPNYKIRYKPFFKRMDVGEITSDDYEISTINGQLEVTLAELSRLNLDESVSHVFCTFAADTLPWVKICQKDEKSDINSIILDLIVCKEKSQNLGVVFKHGPQQQPHQKVATSTLTNPTLKLNITPTEVIADTIVTNSPAYKSGLKRGDLILAIEGKEINNVAQIAKLFKSVNKNKFNVRIQRNVNNYKVQIDDQIKNEELSLEQHEDIVDLNAYDIVNTDLDLVGKEDMAKKLDSSKLSKILSSSNENMSKIAHTLGNFGLRKRKTSSTLTSPEDKNSNSDSSNKSTPTISASNSPDRTCKSRSNAQITHSDQKLLIKFPSETEPEESLVHCQVSGCLEATSMLVFNEEFMVDLKKEFMYLNINVWGKSKVEGPNILLGYVNIPLIAILNECHNSALGHYAKCYSLSSPNLCYSNNYGELSTHNGFEPSICYGDILLSFAWKPSSDGQTPNEEQEIGSPVENPIFINPESNTKLKHDFIRTQFHQSTQCDFCLKKIWLKDAFQCRSCAICCHKKCIDKCQTGTTCPFTKDTESGDSNVGQKNPYIITSTPMDSGENEELLDASPTGLEYHRQSFCSLATNELVNTMKRVNSAHNLTIPDASSDGSHGSRSVPPSSQHTPCRKMSIATTNPFSDCADLLEKLVDDFDANDETLSIIISSIQHCKQNENIMDIAKDASKHLCKNLSGEERIAKISSMIAKLKTTLDVYTNKHCALLQKLNDEVNETDKARLAFQIGEADAHIQALSILMLYFCSGLQDCAS